ncbi:MAG: helix-turn-helix domain-containing protein, partial [Myxococcota bacterium]
SGPLAQGPIRLGSLELSTDRRALGPRGDVGLTQSELELVRTLASRAGEVVDREVLVRIVRGVDYDGLDRTVDIHISRVRRKLERAGVDDVTIVSVRGVGYVMASNLA